MSDLREVLKNLQLAARCIPADTDGHAIVFYIRGWPFSARDMRVLADSPDFRRAPRAPDGRDAVVEAARKVIWSSRVDVSPGGKTVPHGDPDIIAMEALDNALAAFDAEKAGG